jgi:non-ribosomal peptide synthetase-like protein
MDSDTPYDIPVATRLTAASDVLQGEPLAPRFSAHSHSGCLHELFEVAAREWPDAVAIDVPPGRSRPERLLVSYAELERRARAIAARLQTLVTRECVVAIMLPRDSDLLYAAQLAVLKAGAAHMCIDPAFPDDRVNALLADSDAAVLLTDASGLRRTRGLLGVATVFDAGSLAAHSVADDDGLTAPEWIGPSSLAYVIYTSGTTGTPKGTLIEHSAIVNLVTSDLAEFDLGPGDRVVQHSSAVYDSSVEETWLALASGATLLVMDDDAVRLGPDLPAWLRRERATVFCPTPTLLRATGCRDPERELPDLRLLYVGGEALPRDVAERWASGRRLENGYGPTECTVTSLRAWIHSGNDVSIGTPVVGTSAWVLDESLREVPDGETGELCLGGVGLARGYHRRPELTAHRFLEHPALGRIYRTGDLAQRTADGVFHLHGRLDSQVKLRGHRVELEEIEARLARCDGVQEAACCLQEAGVTQVLVAFVVPASADAPPDEEKLRQLLRDTLPTHMVPARITTLTSLPTTTGGKLDRRSLPTIDVDGLRDGRDTVMPRNATEARIAAAFVEVLRLNAPPSVTANFFDDLDGDSLSAAIAVSILQDDPATAAITVRDLYDHPSAADLAAFAAESTGERDDGSRPHEPRPPVKRPVAATFFQSAWLFTDFVIASLLSYVVLFHAMPAVVERIGVVASTLLFPPLALIGLAAYTVATVAYAVWVKRHLVGRYQPMRVPIWGRQWLKHWVVSRAAARIPWWLLEGTEYQKIALRALGARVGERVHIHRGVELIDGGWDLLEIGDDVTLSQGAGVRLIELEAGEMIVGPVVLEPGCTLDVHAGVRTDCRVGRDAFLTAHSSLPRGGRIPSGERWDGIPARAAGQAPRVPTVARDRTFSPRTAGDLLLGARLALVMFLAFPTEVLSLAVWQWYANIFSSTASAFGTLFDVRAAATVVALAVVSVPLWLLMAAIACRVLGRGRDRVVSRWSAAFIPLWLVPDLVDSTQRWLYGTLFWPHWLRLAGARIGRDCEVSSLIDALPSTIDIGDHSFLADGIYLGGARVHRGTVTVRPVALASNVFLGNGAVVPGGVRVPEGTLLGINTVADPRLMRPHTAWFGHPPLRLRRRPVSAADSRRAEHPSALRRASRLFWETARFLLPIGPVLAFVLYLWAIERVTVTGSLLQLTIAIPLISLGTALLPIVTALATKWLLLGRARPGMHPLWSCWASRWDFFCVVWNVYVRELAVELRWTALLAVLLRAAGARVGRGVVLDGRLVEDLPDPDMITIEDGATVEGTFQAHTFEDRVLKNGPVVIRAGATVSHNAVLLYGADVGTNTRVAPHSVIMKHERLLPGISYEGFPIRRAAEEAL